MQRGFTLLELVIVIIILGILATLGYTQYTKVVEKGRGSEIRVAFGQVRQLAISYRLQNGTITGMTNDDVNIGTGAAQIPSSCVSTHYFRYSITDSSGQIASATDPTFQIAAWRCTANGKEPQGRTNYPPSCPGCRVLQLEINLATGIDTWSDPFGAGY